MRQVILFLTFLGIMSVVIGYVRQTCACPEGKVEYRFIPRTFQEDQDNPTRVTELFDTMFEEKTPWIRHIGTTPRRSDLNRYFISQA